MSRNGLVHTNNIQKTGNHLWYPQKTITEIVTNGFFAVDQRWTVKYWNSAAEELLGVAKADIVGKNLWEEFAEIIPVNFYSAYHKAFLQDVPVHFIEYWAEKGTWFEVITYHNNNTLSVSFKSRNQSNNPEHPVRELKILNELYRFVTEVTNDCLWEWDLQNKEIFWIDGGHKRAFGYEIVNALIPQSFWENRLHPDEKTRILAKLNARLSNGNDPAWEDEYRFRKADGEYAYVHDRGHIIYEEGIPVRMIGATQDISSRKSAENKLIQERLGRQKEITHAVLSAQENERTEIGKELHDNLNQVLGAAKLYIEMAKSDEANRTMCLDKAAGFIVNVIEEIRRISKTLASPSMQVMGLFESIRILLDDLKTAHPMIAEFDAYDIDETDLVEKLQLNIFRIVQEQLNNVVKHANATRVIIHMTRKADELILLISDDGDGCDLSKIVKGVGIMNIRSRAELCHGTVKITSKPGHGYSLKVLLPLKDKK
ncbi:MAG TPA: PAS domain-containing protein [Puia sp.]|nr:PAS domain-containing protein [Puia sp.]